MILWPLDEVEGPAVDFCG